jgi:hypothetical protein
VEILLDSNSEDNNSHGYVTVRTRSKPSFKLREQGNFPADGVFDIEVDALTILRPREIAAANPRWKRRIGKPRKVTTN